MLFPELLLVGFELQVPGTEYVQRVMTADIGSAGCS